MVSGIYNAVLLVYSIINCIELSKAEQSIQREGASLEQEKEQSLNQEPEFVR